MKTNINDIKKFRIYIKQIMKKTLKNFLKTNTNLKIHISINNNYLSINFTINDKIDKIRIKRIFDLNDTNVTIFVFVKNKRFYTDISFTDICIKLNLKDLYYNLGFFNDYLNIIGLSTNNEKKLLKELKNNNSFKYEKKFFNLKELTFLTNKELRILSEKTNYNFEKIINYSIKTNNEKNIKKINNIFNYYTNNKYNRKNIRLGLNYLRIIINNYNLYDNDIYTNKDNLKDYLNDKIDLNKNYKDYYLY